MTTLLDRARKWGEERDQQWLEKGERELVRRLVARRFGPGAADDLAPVLAEISDSDRLAAFAARVFECETADELVDWARGSVIGQRLSSRVLPGHDRDSGSSMISPTEITKRGIRSARAGWNAVATAAGNLPGIKPKPSAPDGTEDTPPPEYVIVEDLPDGLKECYLSVLVWLVHFDDSLIDERELCEIQVLMTQLQCNAEVRQAVRSYLEDPQSLEVEAQIARMLELVPSGKSDTEWALRCSLIKDAIRVCRATSEGSAREQPGIRQLAELLRLDDKKVRFIEEACEQEEKILAGELSDRQIKSTAKVMAAEAMRVGVPVAAVYLSGSVTGLSAAGITSGLAALGLGGVLGLSAMVTGIGVAIVAGGAAYKGVRWVLGGSERNRAFRRELMLQDVLRIHQAAIINLAEDISFFGERVEVLSTETDRNRDAIDRIFREVTLMSRSASALTRLRERASGFERDLQDVAGHAAP